MAKNSTAFRILLIAIPVVLLIAAAVIVLATLPKESAKERLARLVPAEYAGLEAPIDAPPPGIEAVYARSCASCHGVDGRGDGPASAALVPQPAPFSRADFLEARDDAYLYWRISEGRRGSAMPGFEQTLTEDQRWGLVLYLRDRWGGADGS